MGTLPSSPLGLSDAQLVAAVRAGDEAGFEELYRRYHQRIAAFVRRLLRDDAKAEDVAQEAFLSAFRRMRETSSEIIFRPWIYEIARNAAIDVYRRTSRAEEVSINADDLAPADRRRLVGDLAPDAQVMDKERLERLSGAFDELSENHHRILVLREIEGLSYREIGERMELTRPAVESALFRARRRLAHEYEEIDTGRRCEAVRLTMGRLAEGLDSASDRLRVRRHVRRCGACRRQARELGIEPLPLGAAVRARAAALLPLPALLRRLGGSGGTAGGSAGRDGGGLGGLVRPFADAAPSLVERAAALVAVSAVAAGAVTVTRDTGSDVPDRGVPVASASAGTSAVAGAGESASPGVVGASAHQSASDAVTASRKAAAAERRPSAAPPPKASTHAGAAWTVVGTPTPAFADPVTPLPTLVAEVDGGDAGALDALPEVPVPVQGGGAGGPASSPLAVGAGGPATADDAAVTDGLGSSGTAAGAAATAATATFASPGEPGVQASLED